MLAQDYAKLKKPLKFPVAAQPKLDGIRALISRHGAFSRELQPHYNCDHILTALAPVFAKFPNAQFDGEFYNHDLKDDFNKIVSVVRKQKPTAEQKAEAARLLQYHVYDLPSAGDQPFVKRTFALMDLFMGIDPNGPVKMVKTWEVNDQARLDELNGEFTEQGYEGQMVRLNEPYDFDTRSKSLLKRKEFQTTEFPVIRIEEGLGNWSGYAKRIVIKLPNGNECGAGMRGTQEFAKNLLARKDIVTGATIRFFGMTPDGQLRFPVAIDFQGTAGRVD